MGWNFAFIGATTMVTQCHRPNERNKVQAFNDFLVFGTMAIASFSSGQLLASFGWATVNEVVFPVVLAAGALLLWSALRGRTPPDYRSEPPRQRRSTGWTGQGPYARRDGYQTDGVAAPAFTKHALGSAMHLARKIEKFHLLLRSPRIESVEGSTEPSA